MGSYLDTPIKEKHVRQGEIDLFRYGAVEMQGWRNTMEDAIIAEPDIVPGVHFFGVFDGHGGNEVADYCQKHLLGLLKASENFKKQKYNKCFAEIFLKLD